MCDRKKDGVEIMKINQCEYILALTFFVRFANYSACVFIASYSPLVHFLHHYVGSFCTVLHLPCWCCIPFS